MDALKKIETNGLSGEIRKEEYEKIYAFFRSIGIESPMMNEILPALAILRFGAWSWRRSFSRREIELRVGDNQNRNIKNTFL